MKKILKTLMIFAILICSSITLEDFNGETPSITIKDNNISQYGDGRDNKDDPGIGYQY